MIEIKDNDVVWLRADNNPNYGLNSDETEDEYRNKYKHPRLVIVKHTQSTFSSDDPEFFSGDRWKYGRDDYISRKYIVKNFGQVKFDLDYIVDTFPELFI